MEAKVKFKKLRNIEMIKSTYILKSILRLISETKKLELIAFNNKIKEKLKITIDNYKNACQRQIIFEPNGKIKEYHKNTNILIFEGEYRNHRRNGKGTEYDFKNNLRIEGEYSNGKIIKGKVYDIWGNIVLLLENGKGKEYYQNGILQFEGEYFERKRWNGKGYYYFGKYDFEIKYGKGNGKEYIIMEY